MASPASIPYISHSRAASPSRTSTSRSLSPRAPSQLHRSVSRASIHSLSRVAPGTPLLVPTAAPAPAQLTVPDISVHFTTSANSSSSSSSSSQSPVPTPTHDDASSVAGTVDLMVSGGDHDPEDDNSSDHYSKRSDGDPVAQKALRDQLRRSLSRRSGSEAALGVNELSASWMSERTAQIYPHPTTVNYEVPRDYYILTNAGKPVFTTRTAAEPEELATAMGVVQAIISVFADENDKLRCINAADGRTRITFLSRSPLIYVCVSSWGEPESVTRFHLEYLHLQILSVMTSRQLQKIFEKRTNFDLRRLLEGTEVFLKLLIGKLESDLAITTASLGALRIDPVLRTKIADTLVPSSSAKIKDLLYVILMAKSRIITLARPRKHSIHPGDLHVLLSTVCAPSVRDSPASWLPVCLPKFNSSGFLHAYVTFPRPDAEIGLVLVSGGGPDAFDNVRNWCETVTKKLEDDGTMDTVERAVRTTSNYSVSELNIPGLRHFAYKSRPNVQVTMPRWEDPYETIGAQRRLITMYQRVHDGIHAKSGQEGPLKLQYVRTQHECVMGWITQPFELYLALSPRLPKTAVVSAANAVARWARREEPRLFLRDAPVF
ncbi:DUF254-domain-containing protein [Auriculariales sp. MPI-PUGE-AT-0066]|nr:DUF254-domain-containing protein [Auriculariales sp. MPI-PUGE-AT-0066]